MIPGLNRARAACAAESNAGNVSSCASSNWHAASREIGCAPSANSAANTASEEKVAIRRYFEILLIEIEIQEIEIQPKKR